MIELNIKEMIMSLENTQDPNSIFRSILFNYCKEVYETLTSPSSCRLCSIPLFDIAALSFTSTHSEVYQKLMLLMFDELKAHL
jgi:hypothetical protein